MVQVVLATHNSHKVDELRRILGPALDGVELLTYDGPEPVEDGDTFEANALIKARAASAFTGLPAIADDSGIAVDALDGAPGIHSARYAGTRDDGDNLRLLLTNLGDRTDRAAQFVCAAALVVPPPVGAVGPDGPDSAAASDEDVELATWPGSVLTEATGSGGFGYDPIFRPEGETRSAAELTQAEKDAASHRAQAFTALAPRIAALA
ncbi:non-canonical purine NTP pyrophosphatase [Frondihabitans sp. PAMC 28766]|uniref:non-canonical purine NTP pyrophosphatase n=1 Tax=Frondihabitans sp. PAMC 28766 TaxID=1795630 RepID=UPI00078DC2F2|nr:non-canonical purine NTP pyrophosphatase [Frondihabitans sp. PAMC 28766]AMM20333.1 non-canonical purine NTP pyrophosphatase [Frondihabitans sp. PAMC 28766]